MKNIMFDLLVTIDTEKDFDDLNVKELVMATLKRVADILEENSTEAFGFHDEFEFDDVGK